MSTVGDNSYKIDLSVNEYIEHSQKGQKDRFLRYTTDESGNHVLKAEKWGVLTWLKAHIFYSSEFNIADIYKKVCENTLTESPEKFNMPEFKGVLAGKAQKKSNKVNKDKVDNINALLNRTLMKKETIVQKEEPQLKQETLLHYSSCDQGIQQSCFPDSLAAADALKASGKPDAITLYKDGDSIRWLQKVAPDQTKADRVFFESKVQEIIKRDNFVKPR